MPINTLNNRFGIHDHITFIEDDNGLTKALVSNSFATAEIYLHGGHITHFQPHDQAPVLWMSPLAVFSPPKAIRGGIPICWPWFGKHSEDPDKPQHGFARNQLWTVYHTAALQSGETELRLQLHDNSETRRLWPYTFELELCITVGEQLQIELITRNTDTRPYTTGAALHTYLHVADIDKAGIEGLDGVTYIDTADAYRRKIQQGAITINKEVDRIYLDTQHPCVLTDAALNRKIQITKAQSATTVIWNPWKEKARSMKDFSDDGYRYMLCIESVNTLDDSVYLEPEQSHSLIQSISLAS